ncbi:MAG: glycosyl transferase WecB/TagA/CpsF family [Ignavibacteria bacterium]|nr:MAG: glycosyl transferase WecB/TagA/CpsF family [Ignavibacteria bacterium]KAF0160635.1 MAG: glycosyl transferase WecB/TagA/CpsF family [Ignavibacteria bacterium]
MKSKNNNYIKLLYELVEKLIKNQDEVFLRIVEAVESQNNLLLTYFNQNSFIVAKSSNAFRRLLTEKFHLFSDGIGIYILQKIMNKKCELFNATDLYDSVFNWLIKSNRKIVIIGGDFSEAAVTKYCAHKKVNLYKYFNGYKDLENFYQIKKTINSLDYAIVIIGIGTPKQEILAEQISIETEKSCVLCTGKYFEYFTGSIRRSPKIFRKFGLEWFFRLISNPQKYFGRYVVGIPKFLFYLTIMKVYLGREKSP